MHVIIVIPCLNEERSLAATCRSLGFGADAPLLAEDTRVILVDNGSTDGTVAVMTEVARNSPSGRVILAHERERGYVPPRHRGVLVARDLVAAAADEVLVLQADADTVYQAGYVDAMRRAAREHRDGMVEGTTRPPRAFVDAHPGYQALSDQVDASVASYHVDPEYDVIVDDKVCGYRLASYFAWGGHVREFNAAGDEVHAETSRLYLRARFMRASRTVVGDAVAEPSRRRVLEDAVLHFATAGFPREASWRAAWTRSYQGPRGLEVFEADDARAKLHSAVFQREAHTLALFGLLPLHVAMLTTGVEGLGDLPAKMGPLLPALGEIPTAQSRNSPAVLLGQVLALIESHQDQVRECLSR